MAPLGLLWRRVRTRVRIHALWGFITGCWGLGQLRCACGRSLAVLGAGAGVGRRCGGGGDSRCAPRGALVGSMSESRTQAPKLQLS